MNRQLKQAVRLLKELRPQNPYVQNKLSVVIKLLTPPRKRPSKELPKQLQSTKPQRASAHKMSTKEIRVAVMERAKGGCEAGKCRNPATVLDHWLGGSGRRKQKEALETCWALCADDNYCRTHNRPSAEFWNVLFREHCERHGYPFTPHIEHKPLPRRGTA